VIDITIILLRLEIHDLDLDFKVEPHTNFEDKILLRGEECNTPKLFPYFKGHNLRIIQRLS
jgi:hypothetical protein